MLHTKFQLSLQLLSQYLLQLLEFFLFLGLKSQLLFFTKQKSKRRIKVAQWGKQINYLRIGFVWLELEIFHSNTFSLSSSGLNWKLTRTEQNWKQKTWWGACMDNVDNRDSIKFRHKQNFSWRNFVIEKLNWFIIVATLPMKWIHRIASLLFECVGEYTQCRIKLQQTMFSRKFMHEAGSFHPQSANNWYRSDKKQSEWLKFAWNFWRFHRFRKRPFQLQLFPSILVNFLRTWITNAI